MTDVEVSIFSIPKTFIGHVGVIQRNALRTWCSQDRTEVLLLGDDETVATEAARSGARHLSGLKVNERGTPLLDSAFDLARRSASGRLLCFVNADIMFSPGFSAAICRVPLRDFLLVGMRCDLAVTEEIDVSEADWFAHLERRAKQDGILGQHFEIDYFAFPRDIEWRVPPFAVGRTIWDNWLVYRAKEMRLPVIDASRSILAIHQSHDYSHIAASKEDVWKGEEALHNQHLSGNLERLFGIFDATHTLSDGELKPARARKYLRQRFFNRPVLSPALRPAYRRVLASTRRLRGLQP